MNVEVGAIKSVWSSFAPVKVVIARIASPPGLFSTTTGLPHLAESLSARTRAVMSTPEPGPSGTRKRTLRCGQVWVCACAGATLSASVPSAQSATSFRRSMRFPPVFLCRLRART